MPWKKCSAVSQRVEFVRLAQAESANLAELCRRFGISRKTGYKWLRRFTVTGTAELADRSRRPNDLWQMDFKGHFAMERGRCHPLTVLDDHSRYCVGLQACDNERGRTVRERLTSMFRRYGLPRRMLMDNGSPWGSDADHPWTPLTVWLLRLDIGVSHDRPYHPQTQGKDERFHRTLKAELLRGRCFENLTACQDSFDSWRQTYNECRPHEALGMEPPVNRYSVSPRAFPEQLPTIEYGPGDTVRRVYDGGQITFRNREYRVGQAFRGYPVGLRPTERAGLLEVYFGTQRIAWIDERTGRCGRGRPADEPADEQVDDPAGGSGDWPPAGQGGESRDSFK